MTKEIQSTKLETSYNCTTRQVEFRISNFVLPSSFDLRLSSLMRPTIPPRPTLDPHVSFPAQAPSLVFGADRHRRDPHRVFSTPRRWRNAGWPGESAQPATAGCTVKSPRFAAETRQGRSLIQVMRFGVPCPRPRGHEVSRQSMPTSEDLSGHGTRHPAKRHHSHTGRQLDMCPRFTRE